MISIEFLIGDFFAVYVSGWVMRDASPRNDNNNNNLDEDKMNICQNMYHLNYIIIRGAYVIDDDDNNWIPSFLIFSFVSTIWPHISIMSNNIYIYVFHLITLKNIFIYTLC